MARFLRNTAVAVAILHAGPFLVAQSSPLEIRFAPKDFVYLGLENRNFGLGNLLLQNVAIVNVGAAPVTVDDVVIEIFLMGDVFHTERLTGRSLVQRLARLKTYLDTPGTITSEDPRFRFKELLGEQPRLAGSTTVEPGAGIYIDRRFYLVDGVLDSVDGKPQPVLPDRLRVSVTGTTAKGERVRATNELRIVIYQPRNEYHFPVAGRWYLASSGSVRSHHRAQPVHEFALDLVQVGDDGRSFRGKGTSSGITSPLDKRFWRSATAPLRRCMPMRTIHDCVDRTSHRTIIGGW